MNPSESESSQSGSSGLQVELGAKSKRRLRLVWLVPLLVLVASSVTLLAWLPNSSSPSFSPTPSATLEGQSTQPKITWSESHLEVILSPGETSSKDVTFSSSLDVQNITIEPVPTLAPFVTVQPNTFANVPASSSQSVRLNFSIPADATLGTYDGTIHVRLGTQTLPQTLKVQLYNWHVLIDATSGLKIRYPAGWTTSVDQAHWVFSSIGTGPLDEDGLGTDIELFVQSLSTATTLEEWVLGNYGVDVALVPPTELTRGTLRDGTPYLRIFGNIPSGNPDTEHVFILKSDKLVTLRDNHADDFRMQFDLMLTSLEIQ